MGFDCMLILSLFIPYRADLIQAKHGVTLQCDFDTEDGNIKATGEKGKTCTFRINIKNERYVMVSLNSEFELIASTGYR